MRFARFISLVALGACLGTLIVSPSAAAAIEVIADASGSSPQAPPPAPLANTYEDLFNRESLADLKRQMDEALATAAAGWTPQQIEAFAAESGAENSPSGAVFSVNGLTAPATAGLSTNFFNRVLAQIAKIINDTGRSMVIPGGSEKQFGYDAIRFSEFSVRGITVHTAAPNKITVSVNGLTISIAKTNFWVKAVLKCKGYFTASIQGATVAVTLALSHDGQGHLRSSTSVSTTIQKVSISHKFNSILCKVANAIVQLFIGNIDKKIASAIKDQMPKMLGPAVSRAVDGMFLKIPLYFTGTPTVVAEGFAVTVDLLGTVKMHYASNPSIPIEDTVRLVEEGLRAQGFDRDITLSVPAQSMNNIMAIAFQQGKFSYSLLVNGNTSLFKNVMPNAYMACRDCRLVMNFGLSVPPYLVFADNNAESIVPFISIAFFGRNASTGANVPLFVMGSNISASLDGLVMRTVNGGISNLFFQVGMRTLDLATKSSSVGPLPALDIIAPVVTFCVKSLAIPAFNVQFTGFNFPPAFNNAYVKSLAGVFEFATDLNIQLQQ